MNRTTYTDRHPVIVAALGISFVAAFPFAYTALLHFLHGST
jgi:hypothetical protein